MVNALERAHELVDDIEKEYGFDLKYCGGHVLL
jgi:hypothetical protein